MKAWRNTVLRFGLVNIPVSLAPARDGLEQVRGHKADATDLQPVKQAWQRSDNGKLATDVVTCYSDGDGNPKQLDKPELDGDKGIDLQAWVTVADVDPVLYDQAYGLWAGDAGDGLGLVAALLRDSGWLLVAQARFTDRPRSCVLRWSPCMGCVVLHTLHYTDSLRATDLTQANAGKLPEPSKALLEQGQALLDALPADWQPLATDPMQAALAALLGLATPAADSDGDGDKQATDLMASLQASYAAVQADKDGKAAKAAKPKARAATK